MKTKKIVLFFILIFPLLAAAQSKRPVDIVICADLGGTTNGLLESLRENIWDLITSLDAAYDDADIRIGIVAHGRPSFGKEDGYCKVLIDLTQDIDLLGAQLFSRSFFLEKGKSNPAKAVEISLNRLKWADDPDAVKILYVIGNRSLKFDRESMMAMAREKEIKVNVIYFRKYSRARELQEWQDLATLGGGELMMANGSFRRAANYPVFDSGELIEKNSALNATYITYAPGGDSRLNMQAQLDEDAAIIGTYLLQSRILMKATRIYQGSNFFWDLVDQNNQSEVKVNKLARENLPENIRNMENDSLKAHIAAKKNERKSIMADITAIGKKRNQYLGEKTKALDIKEDEDTGKILIESIRKILASKGLKTTPGIQ